MRALILTLAVIAGACTSSDEPEAATPTTPDSTETPAASSSSTAAPPSSTSSVPPAGLTASFRGVTEDSIKLGYSHIDFDTLNATFSLGLPFPNSGPVMDVLVEDLNERGGIHGRRIELVREMFVPVGTTTAEEVCAKLVEDEEVFAVIGGFAGPGAQDVNTCITGAGNTILVGGTPTEERLAQSTAPWVAADMSATRRGPAFVNAMVASGELAGLGVLAVHAVDPDQDATADVIRDALIEAGAEVPLRSTGESTGDPTATAAETAVILERARAEGVESIVLVGVNPNISDAIFEADEFTVVVPNTEEVAQLDNEFIDDSDRLIGTGSIATGDDAPSIECIELVEEGLGIDIVPPEDETDDDLAYWGITVGLCRTFTLFELIATEAGPDLTNESFREAIGRVELPELPVYTFASLGPDKPDARDTLSVLEWDNELRDFVEIAGPFDVRE